jgi:hypothetical protein
MPSINRDPLLTDYVKNLFIHPLPDQGCSGLPLPDGEMKELLEVQEDIYNFLSSKTLKYYQNNHLKVSGNVIIEIVTEAVLVMSTKLRNLITSIRLRNSLFSREDNYLDPYLHFFYHKVCGRFITGRLRADHYEFVTRIPDLFAVYRRGSLFENRRAKKARQSKCAKDISRYIEQVSLNKKIKECDYFAIKVPDNVTNKRELRDYLGELSQCLGRDFGGRPDFWVMALDYHFDIGPFVRVITKKEDLPAFFSRIYEDVLFKTTHLLADDNWVEELLTYVFRKHQLLSPVPGDFRVVYRSYR